MDEILDEELSNLLKKHNLPLELIEILAEDAIRMSLDNGDSTNKGIAFYSKDDGKFFAITRCVEKIRRINSQYSRLLDQPRVITYAQDKSECLKTRNPEQVIDLDNLDIQEERRKIVYRYVKSFWDNKLTIGVLNGEVNEFSTSYLQLYEINRRINKTNRILDGYKSKVAKIENSAVPNIFRYRKLKEYRRKVRSYMKQRDDAEKLRETAEKACDDADALVLPRKKRIQVIMSYNSIIGQRIVDLAQKYRIPQETLKRYISESLGIREIPQEFLSLPKKKESDQKKGIEK